MSATDDALRAGSPPGIDPMILAPNRLPGLPGDEGTVLKPVSLGRQAAQRFMANRLAVLSTVILLVLIVVAVCASLLPLIDPTVGDPFNQDGFPSAKHLLGTDSSGHDLLSAII